jgi:hypothetical protein
MRLSLALGRQSIGDFSGCVHPWLKVAVVNGVRERRAKRRVAVVEDIGL